MLSPIATKVINIMPEKVVIFAVKKIVNNYIKKYANVKIEGFDKIQDTKAPIIFISNHLSNSDGIILDKILKETFDPYFIAGVKLGDDPITKMGAKIVKRIEIKPNEADKDAITNMVKVARNNENILIFPEGTRSRTASMIEGKKGVLLVARLTKAKIIPIGITGTDKLLPVAKSGKMGDEIWHEACVDVKFGDLLEIPKKMAEESKHEYDDRCMDTLMKSIASLLPESYRGVYK